MVFTRGATESLNLVRFGWGLPHVKEDDLIVLTIMEHHSNIVPWQLLAAEKGARIEFVGITKDGKLDEGRFEELMEEAPALVAFTQSSNVLGTINDVRKLCSLARQSGATTVVDAAQSVPHMPVDVQSIGCDFLAFSGHKMLGPMGIGILYGRREKMEEMQPFQSGGDMIREVHTTGAKWNDLPYKFEAGTQNVEGAVGLRAAIDYLESLGMDKVRHHEEDIVAYALEQMQSAPGVTVYGPKKASERGGVVSFNMADVHPHDIASILDEEGVAVRSGHHCAQPLIESLGIAAATRASFYVYNSRDEVDVLMSALSKGEEDILYMSSDIYRELILDYYRNPRNFGKLDPHDIDSRDSNPLCGDEVEIQIKVSPDNKIEDIRFYGKGCAISLASASMLTELAKGKPLEWAKELSKDDILKMLGTSDLGPARIKCALLSMKVLKTGVYEYLGANLKDNIDH